MTKEELEKRKQEIEQVELPKVSTLKNAGTSYPYMIGGAVGCFLLARKANWFIKIVALGAGAFAGNKLNKYIIDQQNASTLAKKTKLQQELLEIEHQLQNL